MDLRLVLPLLCGSAFLCDAAAAAETKGSIEGTVVDAVTGEPVRKAYLLLSRGRPEESPAHAVSGEGGLFVASELEPGDYDIHVERQGYLECDCASDVTIGTGQKITGVRIKLTPYAVISGRVVDLDGDPWNRGSVSVYRLTWKQGKRKLDSPEQSDVDNRGMFRIANLESGKYYLAVDPAGRRMTAMNYQMTFYPSALQPESAEPIRVAAGQERNDLEVKLQSTPTYFVRGRLHGLDPSQLDNQAKGVRLGLTLYRSSGLLEEPLFAGVTHKPDGTFEFSGVPSGSYTLKAGTLTVGPMMLFGRLGETEVVVNGHDVNDVVVETFPPRQLKLAIEVEGTNLTLPATSVLLFAVDGRHIINSDPEGTFPQVDLARYEVHLGSKAAAKYYVKSIRAGTVETPGPMLDLRRTGEQPLTIVLSDKGAHIEATVKGSTDLQHTTVTLIPDIADNDLRERLGFDATADYNGVFSFHNIPPGEYRLFAWQDLPEEAWKDPDFWAAVRDNGLSLKLSQSDEKSIELPLVPPQEITALLTRLDIQ